MPDYGLRISLNHDLHTATPEQEAMDTKYGVPALDLNASPAHFGVLDFTWSSNPGVGNTIVTTITHGLSYTPAALVFDRVITGGVDYFTILPEGPPGHYYFAYCTSTQLVIALHRDVSDVADATGEERLFKYYIFSNTGA